MDDFRKCPLCGWTFWRQFKGKLTGANMVAYSCGTYQNTKTFDIRSSWKCVENQNELLRAENAELNRQLDIETKALVITAGMLIEYVDPTCTDENDKQWAVEAIVRSSRADANTK